MIPTSTQRWSEQKQPSQVDRNKSFPEVKNKKKIEISQLDIKQHFRTWVLQRVANDKYPSSDSEPMKTSFLNRFCAMNDDALEKGGQP